MVEHEDEISWRAHLIVRDLHNFLCDRFVSIPCENKYEEKSRGYCIYGIYGSEYLYLVHLIRRRLEEHG